LIENQKSDSPVVFLPCYLLRLNAHAPLRPNADAGYLRSASVKR